LKGLLILELPFHFGLT